jgi:hypothetical protein
MMRAAKSGIAIEALEVELEADYDDGALFGSAAPDVPPGYLEIRYKVRVQSNASEEDILQLLDEADSKSPYLDVFRRAQTCKRSVEITSPKKPEHGTGVTA